MADIQGVLGFQDLVGTIDRFVFPNLWFVNQIPKRNVDGVTAKWDVVTLDIAMDEDFVDEKGTSIVVRPSSFGVKTAHMPTTFRHKVLNAAELVTLRRLGTNERDVRARSMIDLELREMVFRYGAYLDEFMISQMLTGSLAIKINGVSHTIDYEISAGNKPTGGAWSTQSTNILSDLDTWKDLITQKTGLEATTVIVNRKTMRYVMRNTDVTNIVGQTPQAVGFMQAGVIRDLWGLRWVVLDHRYATGQTSFDKKFVADDKVIMIPDISSDWVEMQTGLSVFPNESKTDFLERHGPVSWMEATSNPVGVVLFFRYSRLPILKKPDAVVYATIS